MDGGDIEKKIKCAHAVVRERQFVGEAAHTVGIQSVGWINQDEQSIRTNIFKKEAIVKNNRYRKGIEGRVRRGKEVVCEGV